MIKLNDLEELETSLKSGRIDADFIYGDEEERLEILELLQKLLDVADVADEVATRLIFRGFAAPGINEAKTLDTPSGEQG